MTDAMSDSAAYGDEKRRAVEGDGFKVAPEKFRVHLMDKKGRATCGEDGSEDPIEGKVERTTKLADVTCPFCMPTKCPHGKSLIACLDCWIEQDQAKAAADPRSGDDHRAPSVTVHLSRMSPLGVLLSACGLVSPLAAGHLFGRTIDGVDEVTCEDCKNKAFVPAENKPGVENKPDYASLRAVLDRAYLHAAVGKGKERHASGEAFEDQPIVRFGEFMRGSIVFNVGQAAKKAMEAERLPKEQAVDELIGAINYLAGAVIILERKS